MKLFTNSSQTRFFKTENHVKNLQAIEVNSVADVIERYNLCNPLVLVDALQLYSNDLDQLKTMKPTHEVDSITFDFLKDLSYAEITKQILDVCDDVSQRMIINDLKDAWLYDHESGNDFDVITLRPTDNEHIAITFRHDIDEITYQVVANEQVVNDEFMKNKDYVDSIKKGLLTGRKTGS